MSQRKTKIINTKYITIARDTPPPPLTLNFFFKYFKYFNFNFYINFLFIKSLLLLNFF